MLDEQEAPTAEATDVADVGGDDAVDLADLGADVQTADEPAVTAEELLEIPDAPTTPGPVDLAEARARQAGELGAQAAAEGAAEPDARDDDAAAPDAAEDYAADEDASGEEVSGG